MGFRPYISGSATGAVIRREEVDEDGEGVSEKFLLLLVPKIQCCLFR